ncbi:MAG: hypothetical protein ABSA97_11555 [Verrucomicrobiia bacterium]|jgi:hypothetical protein
MKNDLPDEIKGMLRDLQQEDPAAIDKINLHAKLALGISCPSILTSSEREELARIKRDDPALYRELQVIAEVAQQPVQPPRQMSKPPAMRSVQIAHGMLGLAISLFIVWMWGESRIACYIAALPLLWGLWSLKIAFFSSQDELDHFLYDDDHKKK